MAKVVIKILQGTALTAVTQTILGGPPVYLLVANLYSVGLL